MTSKGDVLKHGDEEIVLHVLHTNDFHNCLSDIGMARMQRAITDLDGAPYLLLDAGDAIKAGNVGVNPFGEPILGAMSDLGYHAMTMGNREFHVWKTALITKIDRARFPVLCANIRSRQPGSELPVQPFVQLETGGLKVAIIGVTVPMVTERMKVAALSSYVFDDPTATVSKLVGELRWSSDVVIVLSHLGLRDDKMLAEHVAGIDLIIGGHSHVVLQNPETIGATTIVQGGAHALWFGHVTLAVGAAGVRLRGAELLPLQEPKR